MTSFDEREIELLIGGIAQSKFHITELGVVLTFFLVDV